MQGKNYSAFKTTRFSHLTSSNTNNNRNPSLFTSCCNCITRLRMYQPTSVRRFAHFSPHEKSFSPKRQPHRTLPANIALITSSSWCQDAFVFQSLGPHLKDKIAKFIFSTVSRRNLSLGRQWLVCARKPSVSACPMTTNPPRSKKRKAFSAEIRDSSFPFAFFFPFFPIKLA